ncbi:MAG TPA: hypothetical protein VFS67_32870 [Polyangiaceae bacterium]|nr:hypothetical protein [Polyangiaceae bacterium]
MSARCPRRSLGALLLGLAAAGCSSESPRGSVMLAISTDLYVDKDVSRVDILVQPEHGPAQSTQVNLFPALEGQYLPGTFAIIEGNEPGEFVRVRLIARQGERTRVVREAALKVPRERTALLTMPIQWLCDGRVRQDGQQARSDCDEGYTCIAGSCKPEEVQEALLPTYRSADVYGGGNATGGGSCFDTLPCFEQSEQPALDLERCLLATPVSDDLNVAAVLPPGGDGHCTDSACWIPLDASELSGWAPAQSGDGVQLPEALCARVRAGAASVRTSHLCPSKSPSTPTCGPWTLVGTEPGDDPTSQPPPKPGDLTPGGSQGPDLGEVLDSLARRLSLDVARACANLVQASPPADPGVADLDQLCQQAAAALPAASLTWYHLPARCWLDVDRQLQCEAACASGCNPGTLLDRCELSSRAGSCDASCDSRQCLGSAGAPTACQGACDGNFSGSCQGRCLGRCDGACDAPTEEGCDGPCDGTCTGLCNGRGEGSCEGLCDADPMLAAPTCTGGALCLGQCSSELESPRCSSALGTSPCLASGCLSDCAAQGRADLRCDPATAWVFSRPGIDPALVANLPGSLSDLIAIRDARLTPALEETTRLRDRLAGNPSATSTTLATAIGDLALLGAVQENVERVLGAMGAPRQGPGPGSNPELPFCDIFKASGQAPLIDDFEDGDSLLLPNEGRTGSWHAGHDGTGFLTTLDPPAPELGGVDDVGSALHLSGGGFTEWGANLNLELRGGAFPYDASAYRGISFWARGSGTRLRVIFMQQNLAPDHPCSTCDPTSNQCGLLYSTELEINEAWNKYTVDWTSLTPPTVIDTPFAPDQLMTIQFEVPAAAAVDLWLDDVSFE